MKNRDWQAEKFSDVKNATNEQAFMPGEFVTLDLGVFYPCGFIP